PTRLDVAWRSDSDYIISDVPTLNGGVPIDTVCMGYVTFPLALGPRGLTGGSFWHELSKVWQLACETALGSRPTGPTSSLVPGPMRHGGNVRTRERRLLVIR